jgi:hypothetical protein
MNIRKLAMYAGLFLRNAQIGSPNITIQPGSKEMDCAKDIANLYKPNIFTNVKEVIVGPSSDYGHVESGPGKDPHIVYINADRIVSESGGKQNGQVVAVSAARVIIHEIAHVQSFNQEQGFVGGEVPAQQAERDFDNWLSSGGMKRVEALPSYQALGH